MNLTKCLWLEKILNFVILRPYNSFHFEKKAIAVLSRVRFVLDRMFYVYVQNEDLN